MTLHIFVRRHVDQLPAGGIGLHHADGHSAPVVEHPVLGCEKADEFGEALPGQQVGVHCIAAAVVLLGGHGGRQMQEIAK